MTADGVASPPTVTVTVEDANGNLHSNAAVALSSAGTGDHFAATTGTTNAQGLFTTTLFLDLGAGQRHHHGDGRRRPGDHDGRLHGGAAADRRHAGSDGGIQFRDLAAPTISPT